MSVQRPRVPGESVRKPLPKQARGMQLRYGPAPIERTLRARQALQPCSSEPCLGSTAAATSALLSEQPVSLPRTGSSSSVFSPSGLSRSSMRMRFTPIQKATGTPCSGASLGGSGYGGGLKAEPVECDLKDEAWLGMLNGGRRVAIPFNKLSANIDDTDSYVHWYRQTQDQVAHQMSILEVAAANDRNGPAKPTVDWAERRDTLLARRKNVVRNPGMAMHCKAGAELYDYLDSRLVPPGPPALAEALRFRTGSLEEAMQLLDVHGSGEVTLMEFAGGLSLLGLNTATLLGADEGATLKHLDPEGGSFIKLRQLTRAPARGPRRRVGGAGSAALAAGNEADDGEANFGKARQKWAAVARWMATAMRRSTALSEDRFRRGWRLAGSGVGGEGTPLLSPKAAQAAAKLAAGCGLDSPKAGGMLEADRKRYQATPAQVLMESAAAMREQEQDVKAFFGKAASAVLEGSHERMLQRSEMYSFFDDLALVEQWRHTKLSHELLDRHYDDAMKIQVESTKLDKGLLFWSFKALLNNLIGELRLGWQSLIERTLIFEES